MFSKKITLSLLLAFTIYFTHAQTCDLVLRGCVTDQDSHEHLGFAIVKLLNNGKLVQTNEHGEFSFDHLCAGTYHILIKHLGCKDSVFQIDVTRSRKVDLLLPHSINNLEELNIMDKRVEMKRAQSSSSLSAQELQQQAGQNLGDILKNMSGLTVLNTGATISKPMIHGMQGYRILILNNGIRQEGQQWGSEHAPEIDPYLAKKITVIKGASAIRYGSDAMAGVVLVEPEEIPDSAGLSGDVHLAAFSNGRGGVSSAMLQGRFQKFKSIGWRIQGTLKESGSVKTPRYFLSNTGAAEQNFSYALDVHKRKWGAEWFYSQFNTQIGIYTGSHIGNLSDLQSILLSGKANDTASGFSYAIQRPNQVVFHELMKGVLHYHLSSQWRFRLTAARQFNARQEYDLRRLSTVERESGKVFPDLDLSITSKSLEGILEHDNIRSFRGMFGASYMNQVNVYTGRFFIPNYKSTSWGVFATERYVWRHAEWEAGVRYDAKDLHSYYYKNNVWTNSNRQFSNTGFNTGFIWKPDTSLQIVLNTGSAWRAPAANELYSDGIHQGIASIERGDESLNTERCYNITASAVLRYRKWRIEYTVYHNQFSNFIYLNPTGDLQLTIRGAFPVFEYRQASARISGMDVMGEWYVHKQLSLVVKGMMVRGWNYSIAGYLINMPSDRADISIKYKLPEMTFARQAYFQCTANLVNKQWRIPPRVDFALPPPAYVLLGADLGGYIRTGRQLLFIQLSATNLLNTVYREYLDRFRYFADSRGVSYNIRLSIPFNKPLKPKKYETKS